MMLSPEEYYQRYLKNLDANGLKEAVENLQEEFHTLKANLEDPEYDSDITLEATQIDQIQMNRQYLIRAIQVAELAGYELAPIDFIQEAKDFNEHLLDLEKLSFEIGGPSMRQDRIDVLFKGDQGLIQTFFSQEEGGENELDLNDDAQRVDKEAFITALQELYMGEWQDEYQGKENQDIHKWSLSFKFKDGSQQSFSGENAYPYNFSDLLGILAYTF